MFLARYPDTIRLEQRSSCFKEHEFCSLTDQILQSSHESDVLCSTAGNFASNGMTERTKLVKIGHVVTILFSLAKYQRDCREKSARNWFEKTQRRQKKRSPLPFNFSVSLIRSLCFAFIFASLPNDFSSFLSTE